MAQALFLVLVLSGFCSCGHKPYPQPLITADSLILPVLHYYIESVKTPASSSEHN
jgi:hypothetical protein